MVDGMMMNVNEENEMPSSRPRRERGEEVGASSGFA